MTPELNLLKPSSLTTLACSNPYVVSTFYLSSILAGNFECLQFVVFLALLVYYESHTFKV